MATIKYFVTKIHQNNFFRVQQKKEIPTGLEQV